MTHYFTFFLLLLFPSSLLKLEIVFENVPKYVSEELGVPTELKRKDARYFYVSDHC